MQISLVKSILILILGITIFSCSKTTSTDLVLISPNGKINLHLYASNKSLKYTVDWDGVALIDTSKVSFFKDIPVELISFDTVQVQQTWKPVWGQFNEIKDSYKEMCIQLKYNNIPSQLFIRAYNEGVAFRFKADSIPETLKPSFNLEYVLQDSDMLYMTAGEREPIGPITIDSLKNRNHKKREEKLPFVVETKSKKYMALLESDLYKAKGFKTLSFHVDTTSNKLIGANTYKGTSQNIVTPWRVILLEEKLGDLITNTLPQNVATPLAIKDPSWIKPGKTLWDWRVHGYTADDGFTYGINTESYLRFIDFAAEKNIEYFLIDDAWYTTISERHIELSSKLDLTKVSSYAKEKGVSLLLYYDQRKGNYGDEALFPYYKSLGMKGIKYGFMGDNDVFTRDAIRMSSESNLHIDFHDSPVPMTGVTRTYPNVLSKEYCHAQQDSRRAFTPRSFIKMALINALQGPLDMNNGIFDIKGVNAGERQKGPKVLNSLKTTVTAEAARTLIILSGLVCIPDAPEAYREKSDLFEFIEKMPVGQWDDTRILHAKMGDYITTARKHEDEWFIGSVHATGGILPINFNFLEEGQQYDITYYEDAEDTHSDTNPEAYRIRKETIKKEDSIHIRMVKGGGHCMWIRPSNTIEN